MDKFILFFKIVLGKTASAARNWINSFPQTEETTFAFFLYLSFFYALDEQGIRGYEASHYPPSPGCYTWVRFPPDSSRSEKSKTHFVSLVPLQNGTFCTYSILLNDECHLHNSSPVVTPPRRDNTRQPDQIKS